MMLAGRQAQAAIFAQWLNGHLARLGYSNNKASQLMNVGAGTMSGWRNGIHMPSANAARAISFALSVSELEVLCHLFDISDEDLMAELARRGV